MIWIFFKRVNSNFSCYTFIQQSFVAENLYEIGKSLDPTE